MVFEWDFWCFVKMVLKAFSGNPLVLHIVLLCFVAFSRIRKIETWVQEDCTDLLGWDRLNMEPNL